MFRCQYKLKITQVKCFLRGTVLFVLSASFHTSIKCKSSHLREAKLGSNLRRVLGAFRGMRAKCTLGVAESWIWGLIPVHQPPEWLLRCAGRGAMGKNILPTLPAALREQCSPTLGCGQQGRAAVWGRLEEMPLKISSRLEDPNSSEDVQPSFGSHCFLTGQNPAHWPENTLFCSFDEWN